MPGSARSTRVTVVLVAALAILLAACSSGGGIQSSSDATDLPKDEKDRVIVEEGKLRLMDFPAGWAIDTKEDEPNAELGKVEDAIPECARVNEINKAASLGKAESPDFVSTIEAQASNNVEIYVDPVKVDEMQALAVSPDSISCLQQGLRTVLNLELANDPKTAPYVKSVEVNGGAVPVPAFGDGGVGANFQATVDLGVTQVNLYIEFVAVKVGRTQASYMFMDDLVDPAGDVQARVIESTVGRLRAAGA